MREKGNIASQGKRENPLGAKGKRENPLGAKGKRERRRVRKTSSPAFLKQTNAKSTLKATPTGPSKSIKIITSKALASK